VTATKSTARAHEELATAQDLAAYKGTSVTEAADAITKAQQGNTRALKEMGIATTDTAGKQLPAAALMKQLEAAVRGQADAFGKTAPGQMARFHESMDQTKEKIGEALMPALKSVLAILQPLFAWLSHNQKLLSTLAPIIAIAAGAVVAITYAMKVWTAVQWALNAALDGNPIGIVIMAVAALIAIVVLVIRHWSIFRGIINATWGALRDVGAWIMAHWRIIITVLLGPLGFVIANFQTIYNVIMDVLHALEKVGDAVSKALGWLGKLPHSGKSLWDKITRFSLPPSSGPAPMPTIVNLQVVATPGDDLPDVVYWALKEYQRRHVRPELAPLFARRAG
jgi:hypothetical protein